MYRDANCAGSIEASVPAAAQRCPTITFCPLPVEQRKALLQRITACLKQVTCAPKNLRKIPRVPQRGDLPLLIRTKRSAPRRRPCSRGGTRDEAATDARSGDPSRHAVGNDRYLRAPWEGGAFQRVQAPSGQPLQPEATGAVMEVTKSLKPSVWLVTYR